MADEKKRIISLTEKSAIDSGDFVAIDNSTGGTKKYQLKKLASSITVDSALSTSSTNPVQNAVITNNLPASASISSGVISYKNSSGTTLFTVTLPLYNGGIG